MKKSDWLKRLTDGWADDELEAFYLDHPEMRRGEGWYTAPLISGLLSLSFSLGWAWRGIAGAAILVPFVGIPCAIVGVMWWSRAADESLDGSTRLYLLRLFGLGVGVIAVIVYFHVFSRH